MSCSYSQVLGHVQQLLPQTAEGGQQQAHTLVSGESGLTRETQTHTMSESVESRAHTEGSTKPRICWGCRDSPAAGSGSAVWSVHWCLWAVEPPPPPSPPAHTHIQTNIQGKLHYGLESKCDVWFDFIWISNYVQLWQMLFLTL